MATSHPAALGPAQSPVKERNEHDEKNLRTYPYPLKPVSGTIPIHDESTPLNVIGLFLPAGNLRTDIAYKAILLLLLKMRYYLACVLFNPGQTVGY